MKSSLEIAQEAELGADRGDRRAVRAGARRVRALRALQGEGLAVGDRPTRRGGRRQARVRPGDDAHQGAARARRRRAIGLTQGLGAIGKAPVLCLREPSLGPVFGIKGGGAGGGLSAGRADGGPEPPLHRRHPRGRRGQQPARRDARRLDPARQPAQHRRIADRLATRGGHERPRAAHRSRSGSAAARTAIRARPGSTSPRPRR